MLMYELKQLTCHSRTKDQYVQPHTMTAYTKTLLHDVS